MSDEEPVNILQLEMNNDGTHGALGEYTFVRGDMRRQSIKASPQLSPR